MRERGEAQNGPPDWGGLTPLGGSPGSPTRGARGPSYWTSSGGVDEGRLIRPCPQGDAQWHRWGWGRGPLVGPRTPLIQLSLHIIRPSAGFRRLAEDRLIEGQGLCQLSRLFRRRRLPTPHRLCRRLGRLFRLGWRWGELLAPLAQTLLQLLAPPVLHRQLICRLLTTDPGVCQCRFVVVWVHPIA